MYGGSQYSLSAVLVSVLPAFSALIPGGLAASLTNQGEVLGDRLKHLRRPKGAFLDLQRENILIYSGCPIRYPTREKDAMPANCARHE